MRNYEVTLLATARKTIGIRAPDIDSAINKAADSVDTSDFDLGDWEIVEISIDDAEECEEDHGM